MVASQNERFAITGKSSLDPWLGDRSRANGVVGTGLTNDHRVKETDIGTIGHR